MPQSEIKTEQPPTAHKPKRVSLLFNESFWTATVAVLTAFAAGAGIWALYLTNKSSREKEAALEAYKVSSKAEVATANARADEAKGVAAKAEQGAAEANASLAQANAAIALAQKDATNARLETEKLKTLVSWRQVSDEAQGKFKEFVAGKAKGAVVVTSVSGDPEAANFGRQLVEMLTASEFETKAFLGTVVILGTPPVGVVLQIQKAAEPPAYAGVLQKGLAAAGIAAPGELHQTGGVVNLFVGSKP